MFKYFKVGTAPFMPGQNQPWTKEQQAWWQWWLYWQNNKKEGENFFRIRYVNVGRFLEKIGKIYNNLFSECIMNACHSSLFSRID